MKSVLKLVAATAVAAFSLQAHADFVLDTFTTTQYATDNTTLGGGVWAPGVSLGAGESTLVPPVYRDIYVQKNGQASTNGLPAGGAVSTLVNGVSNKLTYSQDTEQWGFSKVYWTGVANASTNPTFWTNQILDATLLDPTSAFYFTYSSDGVMQVDISIYDTAGNFTTTSFFTDATGVNVYVPEVIYFGEFDFGSIDPTSIGAIVLHINANDSASTASIDLAFTPVHIPVPEPLSVALVGLGLMGVAAVRRRTAKA